MTYLPGMGENLRNHQTPHPSHTKIEGEATLCLYSAVNSNKWYPHRMSGARRGDETILWASRPITAVMHKTYELVCQLPAREASERIERLLSKEGVSYTTANLSVASTQTPIAVLGFQRNLYSQSNWVGVNPFAFISGVNVVVKSGDDRVTKVSVSVNRRRAFLWVAWWVVCGSLTASAMPQPAGALFFVGFSCAAWFGIASFLGGYLIKKEIGDCLRKASTKEAASGLRGASGS